MKGPFRKEAVSRSGWHKIEKRIGEIRRRDAMMKRTRAGQKGPR
jgi:hypothetical protein